MMRLFRWMPVVLLLVIGCVVQAAVAKQISDARAVAPAPSIESPDEMVGETFSYDISFLWFDRLAEGSLRFEEAEQDGQYRAILEAKTLGVAAFFTRDRRERHVSLMKLTPNGGLRSLEFESTTSKGRGRSREDRVRRYIFDYENDKVYREQVRTGKKFKRDTYELQNKKFVNDVLTAFSNFRMGYFGAVEPGAHFDIPAFSRKGPASITIDVLTAEERVGDPRFPAEGLVCRVHVDKEIFKTGDGRIYLWIDEQARPAFGVVEKVLGLGDVRGTLRN